VCVLKKKVIEGAGRVIAFKALQHFYQEYNERWP
jgi:hypothetical protein